MITLREKQSLFAFHVSRLIQHARELGYEVTLGDAYRDPRLHGALGEKKGYGHRNSCHKIRLAIDLNLFKDGKFPLAAYDFHHTGDKVQDPSTIIANGSVSDIAEEISKCVLLCANCHRVLHSCQ